MESEPEPEPNPPSDPKSTAEDRESAAEVDTNHEASSSVDMEHHDGRRRDEEDVEERRFASTHEISEPEAVVESREVPIESATAEPQEEVSGEDLNGISRSYGDDDDASEDKPREEVSNSLAAEVSSSGEIVDSDREVVCSDADRVVEVIEENSSSGEILRENSEIEFDDVSAPSSSGYVGERGSSCPSVTSEIEEAEDGSVCNGAIPQNDSSSNGAHDLASWVPGNRHDDEDDTSISWRKRKKHFFVLSHSGKPIYSRYGNEHKLAGFSATLQAIISFVENGGDHVNFVRAGNHQAEGCVQFTNPHGLTLPRVFKHKPHVGAHQRLRT